MTELGDKLQTLSELTVLKTELEPPITLTGLEEYI